MYRKDLRQYCELSKSYGLQKNVVQLIKILQSKISFYEKNINY